MATCLLDTVTFSLLMERHPRVLAQVTAAVPDHFVIVCTVVRGEILYALARMAQGRRRRHLEATAQNLFAQFPCEPIREDAADIYARVKTETERQGTPLDDNDLWIAATALAHRAILVSSDTDFRRVDGLEVQDWTV
ncbi:MAG TPA: type II toxin-antitoxin system VapC family toxin [Planctomycetota bacterium]|nr:type II toxin-antitoxin system VapC family toxin [Planctomycetota bacterium]